MDHPPAALGPQAERTSPLAWIALALTFAWVVPLGLVLGMLDSVLDLVCTLVGAALAVVVLLRSRHGIDHGRLVAWIALGSVAVHLALTFALGLITVLIFDDMDPNGDAEWASTPSGLVQGDCLLSELRPVPTSCEEPHLAEVVGTYSLPEAGWFDIPEDDADALCGDAVAEYLDITADEAAWRYGFSISGDGPYEVSCWALSEVSVTGTMRANRP